jgi:hypothetical protein
MEIFHFRGKEVRLLADTRTIYASVMDCARQDLQWHCALLNTIKVRYAGRVGARTVCVYYVDTRGVTLERAVRGISGTGE